MAIKPDFFKPYHLSDIRQGATYKDGKRTFRGYGTDSTDRTDNIIYITHIGLKRMVSFKAFIESYKLNLSKKIEFFQEGDKNDKPMSEYGTDISYSLVINVPAHSVNESRNNMAKLEEIQRLISTMGNETERSILYGTNLSIFSVWFKNLICSGHHYKSYPNTTNVDIDTVVKLGFLCYIDKIDFQPDFEAGFFDYDDVTDKKNGKFLFPKNIKLNMQLKYGSQPTGDLNNKLKAKGIDNSEPVSGFDYNGDYVITDNGGWPLNLYVSSKKTEFLGRKPDIYEEDMNDIGKEYMSKNSFVFLCNSYKKTDSGIERGVLFKPFIESFNRNYEQSYPVISGDKGREFGEVLDTSTTSTFKSLDYKFRVQVPSESLEEAMRNTAKIQYLVRLFVKKFKPSKIIESSNRKATASRIMTIYIPSFIEKANASTFQTTSYDAMVDNGLGLIVTNISFDIDLDQGFFEKDGKLFPKSYSLDFEATSVYSDLIVNYAYSDGDFYMLDSSTIKGEEHLFPFNRQTSKLILGL